MKYTLELTINKPRAEVWKAFDSIENQKEWQPSLTKFEHVSGKPDQPDAVSKLTYEENEREFSLIEKIINREEPARFDGLYENEFSENTIRNSFVEQSENETLWIVENEFKFKTSLMKIMGPLMKKNFAARTQKDMGRFKEFVENL